MLFFRIFATYETHRGNFHLGLKEICSYNKVKTLAEWIERDNINWEIIGSNCLVGFYNFINPILIKTVAKWVERGNVLYMGDCRVKSPRALL